MEKLIWSPDYSVGIDVIDQQHQKMFMLIDRLQSLETDDVHTEEFADVLNEMTNYAKEHFETEENLLKSHGYPEFEAHVSHHLVFLERAAELNFDTVAARSDTVENTLTFLRLWWHHHILNTDMKYRDFLLARGAT